MKPVGLGQLTDTSTGLVVGDQRLQLDRGEPMLSLPQLTHVRTPRILKHRDRRLLSDLATLPDPAK